MTGRDYEILADEVVILQCDNRACHDVTIVDDTQLELEELFSITLERSAALQGNIRIIQERSLTEITIIDTDGNV